MLRALGVDDDLVRASLRFGLGRFNTAEEVEFAISTVAEAVGRQDAMLLGSKLLLHWTHRILEACAATETDIALLRTWLNRTV